MRKEHKMNLQTLENHAPKMAQNQASQLIFSSKPMAQLRGFCRAMRENLPRNRVLFSVNWKTFGGVK